MSIRYALLALQMLIGFFSLETALSVHFALLILLFINNQLRYYVFQAKSFLIVLSFTIELLLLTNLDLSTPLHLAIASWPLLFDIAYSTNLKLRYRILATSVVLLYLLLSSPDRIFAVILSLPIVLFSYSLMDAKDKIKERTNDYLEADNSLQQLKDKLELTEHERMGREELAILRERNRISRDIHDSVGHSLSTILIQLQAIELLAKKDPDQASRMAHNLGDFGRESLAKIREALRELKPDSYSAYELVLILDELGRQTEKLSGLVVFFRYTGEVKPIGQDQGQALYWVTKEFMTNSTRHGQAKHIWLHLHFRKNELIYNLEDDGIGIKEDSSFTPGIGMRSMRERIVECQGTWEWWSPEQKGLHMKIVMPLEKSKG